MVIASPEFRGANLALGACRDIEVCLDGAAGTGKTVAALFKVHMLLTMYPGAKALVARKTNTALAGSAVATYRDMIHPEEGIRYFGGNRIRPAAFEYPNGSSLIVNGLDKPEKIKSWEFSIAYLNESTELTIEDLEFVRSRLRQGKTPYPQVIMDCNPGSPQHWLNVRMNEGITTRLVSTHEDNPRYFDVKTNDWTAAGREYIFGTLGGLTGVRLSRLRYGMWSAADGAIYEREWSRSVNVIKRFQIPPTWRRWLSIDLGYTNPFVCQWFASDPDGRLYRYREIYRTNRLVEDHAIDIAVASGWFHLLPTDHPKYKKLPADWADPLPQAIICDHDIEDRRTLERHLKLNTTAAKKTVSDGIQAVAARLRPAGDGKPRLYFLEDSLVERDPDLAARKKPTCFEEEIEGYVWKQGSNGPKEEPVKEDDHACLVAGTLVTTDHGDVPIEMIKAGDYVLTMNGGKYDYRRVKEAGMTEQWAPVHTVWLSNHKQLIGTANHPVYVAGKGFTPLIDLQYGDLLVSHNAEEEVPHVGTIMLSPNRRHVYNLTVETQDGEEGTYFANGILVHNCDATRYMVAHLDTQPSGVSYVKGFWR
jgi:phage terminase large subunit